jgi:hypothetical protein
MGIAFGGGEASWASVDGVKEGIDMYVNDGETWDARN